MLAAPEHSRSIDAFIARIAALPPVVRRDVALLLLWGLIGDIFAATQAARLRMEGGL